ncbi:MAG TPA: hypothetical protein VH280_11845, partial [Verrucomicrobiae bacterium]|nr:hypothetical protein [Verrucomicrobiae bacterium]
MTRFQTPKRWLRNVALFCCLAPALHAHAGAILTNDTYRIELKADNSVSLSTPGGGQEIFRPDFKVLYSPDAVSMTTAQGPENCHLWVPYWKTPGGKKTANYFEIVPASNISAIAATATNNTIRWRFPSSSLFSLDAELTLPDKEGPRVTFTLKPLKPGYFSVGYAGAPIVS